MAIFATSEETYYNNPSKMLTILIVLIIISYLIGSLSADMFFNYLESIPFLKNAKQKFTSFSPLLKDIDIFANLLFEFSSGFVCALLATHFLKQPLLILVVCFAGVFGQIFPLFKTKYDNSFPIFAGTLAVIFGWFFVFLIALMWIFIKHESKMILFTHAAILALVPILALITGQSFFSIGYASIITLVVLGTRYHQIKDLLSGKNNDFIVNT